MLRAVRMLVAGLAVMFGLSSAARRNIPRGRSEIIAAVRRRRAGGHLQRSVPGAATRGPRSSNRSLSTIVPAPGR